MNVIIFIIAFISTAHSENLKDLHKETWHRHVPQVVICNDSKLDITIVQKAMDLWKQRGHIFSGLIKRDCDTRPNRGEIALYPAKSGDLRDGAAAEAMTTVYTREKLNGKEEIAYARIWVHPSHTKSVLLLEHELGHALGYSDVFHHNNSVMSTYRPIY